MNGPTREIRRLLGTEDIERALQEVAWIARRERTRVLLVGGVALYYYGSERLTADVDVVAQIPPPPDLPDEGTLSFGGIRTRTPGGVPLDWITRDDDFAHVFREALDNGCTLPGVPIPVVGREYLVAMKMISGRDKDDQDLIALLQSGEVDIPNARRIIKRLLGAYAAQDFDGRVLEAEWRAARGGRGSHP